jgi:CBS domain-containing protein
MRDDGMKSVSFFLTPKKEIVYLDMNSTMRQAIEKMEYHRYTAIPLIDEEGKYVGTLTEGDLLWKLKNDKLDFDDVSKIRLPEIKRKVINTPVKIDANMEELMDLALVQNFVPVIDDFGTFIGIVTRQDILSYLLNKDE